MLRMSIGESREREDSSWCRCESNCRRPKRRVPLNACSEFAEDDFLWNLEPALKTSFMDAAYVTLDDLHRPNEVEHHRIDKVSFLRGISSEHDTVGIRQTVRLLLAHGSDIASKQLKRGNSWFNPFPSAPANIHLEIPVASRCEALVDELLHEIEITNPPDSKEDKNDLRARSSSPGNAYL